MFRSYSSARYSHPRTCRMSSPVSFSHFSSICNSSSSTFGNCLASVRFASYIRTPGSSFRLREMMRFLQLEPFAVDQSNPYITTLPVFDPQHKAVVEDACRLAFAAAKDTLRNNPDRWIKESEKASPDVIYEDVANQVIDHYDKARNSHQQHFAVSVVTNSWSEYFMIHKDCKVKIHKLRNTINKNNDNLRRLLSSSDQLDVLSVAQIHSDICIKDDSLKDFYRGQSVVVMSNWLAGYTAWRFVAPSSTLDVSLTSTDKAIPMPVSAKVNVVGGWSGAGKSSAATLPSGPAPTAKLPICVVISAKEIFPDLGQSNNQPPPTNNQPTIGGATSGRMQYADFKKLGDTHARDDLAASLLASGILNAFNRYDCSANYKLNTTGTMVKKTKYVSQLGKNPKAVEEQIRVPDFDDFFEPGVEEKLAGQINTNFGGNNEYRIVLDEAGDCPYFVRAACKIWFPFRSFLQKVFRIDNVDNIFLYVVGSGAESVGQSNAGTYPSDYTIFFVRNNCFFADLLKHKTTSIVTNCSPAESARQDLYRKMFEMLFEVNSNGKQFARVSTHDARTFLHLVSDNARCAALGMRLISRFVVEHASFDYMASRFSTWSADIAAQFVRLNGLSCSPNPFVEIGKALRIVMSRTHADLSVQEMHNYLVRFGILVDTKLSSSTFATAKPLLLNRPRYRIQQSFVTMFLLHKKLEFSNDLLGPNDSFEHVVANHHALCLVLQPLLKCGNVPSSLKLFESVATSPGASVETVVLRVRLTDGVTTAQAKAILKKKNPSPLTASKRAQLNRTFGDAAKKWKDTVAKGGAVVIINGPEAPLADVIVLTAGKLFLTQCKYYQSTTTLAQGSVEEELNKMLASPQNVFTRTLLRECCAVGTCNVDHVEVVASIVVLFKATIEGVLKANATGEFKGGQFKKGTFKDGTSNITWKMQGKPIRKKKTKTVTNFQENFKYSKRFICSFMNSDNVTAGTSLPIDFENDGTNSELYPLLTSPLDQAHLADAEKGLIVESKTRHIVD